MKVCPCGENVGKISKTKIANFLTNQKLAIFTVPGAGIEPARALLPTGF
jgi:hypothetical protein